MNKNELLNSIICFFIFLSSLSQELPPIENYSPKVYAAENQNWGISQSDDKFIYVANNSGLLEFNGAKWKLYPSPNKSVVRSVNAIGNRIYTGCFREFGYWLKNDLGRLEYTSLINKFKGLNTEDQHFWNIVSFEDWVIFQSLRNLYVYNTKDETFDIITSKTKLTKVFKVDGSIYFQKLEEGIYKFERGIPKLISNDEIVQKNEIINIFSIDGEIHFITQENGFYLLGDNGLSKWNNAANDLISSISVYSSIVLKDGSIVLGTISDGIFQIDHSGAIINEINQVKGLNNNTILSMFQDTEQNLWLALDIGISVVNLEDPYRVLEDKNGNLGSVYASVIFEENLYIGTNQGLFYRELEENDEYQFIEGTEGQVWCLKVFDETLFCGHNNGTFIVDGGKVDLISQMKGTWDIKQVPNNNNLLIQGHYGGLNILENVEGKWEFKNEIFGFADSSRFFEFQDNNEILVNHESKGGTRLTLNDDYTSVIEKKLDTTILVGINSSLTKYNETLFYTSKEGVFIYDDFESKFKRDASLSSELFVDNSFVSGKLIHVKEDNTLWGFTEKNIIRFSQGKLNEQLRPLRVSLTSDSRAFISSYENVTYLSKDKYLFGGSYGYIIIDLAKLPNKNYHLKINAIEKGILNKERTAIPLKGKASLEHEENNLFIEYSVAEFEKYKEVYYQYQLKGFYEEWSDWSKTPEVFFKNLPFGDYTFNVKARIGDQKADNVESFEFSIDRPWFLSNRMIFGYGLIILFISLSSNRIYNRYYTAKQRKAVERAERILKLENLENEKALMKFRNDNLRNDIESKNRELGTSTMNLIKKNEFLNDIKKELKSISETPKLKKVIGIIDKNLNSTDDWKLFETAFNNADKGFLNKVKDLHPQLTPNDLRLCAYLRLNLSSKEIAPLLNISPRSVEIKRYRLRKKIELPRENNLTQYFLEI